MNTMIAGVEGVVLCGLFGTGKSTVAEEIANILERARVPYAAIDLDWLAWFDTGEDDPETADRVFLANLADVVRNELGAGVRYVVLAGWLGDQDDLDAIRGALGFPVFAVELRVPWDVVERRLRAGPTSGRLDDLHEARAHLEHGRGPHPDAVVDADRPVAAVASEILGLLGWLR